MKHLLNIHFRIWKAEFYICSIFYIFDYCSTFRNYISFIPSLFSLLIISFIFFILANSAVIRMSPSKNHLEVIKLNEWVHFSFWISLLTAEFFRQETTAIRKLVEVNVSFDCSALYPHPFCLYVNTAARFFPFLNFFRLKCRISN